MAFCAKSVLLLNAARLHGNGDLKQPQLTHAAIPNPQQSHHLLHMPCHLRETTDAASVPQGEQQSGRLALGNVIIYCFSQSVSTQSKQTFQVTIKLFSRFPGSWTQ